MHATLGKDKGVGLGGGTVEGLKPYPVLEGHFERLQPEVLLMGLDGLPWGPELHPHHGHVQLIMRIQEGTLGQRQGPAT